MHEDGEMAEGGRPAENWLDRPTGFHLADANISKQLAAVPDDEFAAVGTLIGVPTDKLFERVALQVENLRAIGPGDPHVADAVCRLWFI